jgi:hypothetical protein
VGTALNLRDVGEDVAKDTGPATNEMQCISAAYLGDRLTEKWPHSSYGLCVRGLAEVVTITVQDRHCHVHQY